MYVLTRNVAGDKCLRQPLRELGRPAQARQMRREGEGGGARPGIGREFPAGSRCPRPGVRTGGTVDREPACAPADLVAGAFDQQAAGGDLVEHRPPGRANRRRLVLAEHVHRADQHGAPPRELESAVGEGQPWRACGRSSRRHPSPVDLQPDDLDVGHHPRQPVVELNRGDRGRAEAEVDDQRSIGAAQAGSLRSDDPAIDSAQAVRIGCPAGRDPQRPGPTGGEPRRTAGGKSTGHRFTIAGPWRSPRRALDSPPADIPGESDESHISTYIDLSAVSMAECSGPHRDDGPHHGGRCGLVPYP